jgi:type II secretory pathway pseudopilin PulG
MRKRSGTTLLELMVASTLLTVIVLLSITLVLRSSATSARLTRAAHLETRAREFTTACRTALLTARMSGSAPTLGGVSTLGVHSNYTELRYQVPVARDEAGVLSYGYSSSLGVDDLSGSGPMAVIRFEAEEILKEGSSAGTPGVQPAAAWGAGYPALPELSTVTLGVDVNRDGDLSDTYVRGRVVRYAVSAAGARISSERLSDSVVLQVEPGSPEFPYDMVDPITGMREPLFRFVDAAGALVPGSSPGTTGVALVVTVWHGASETEGKGFVLRKSSERIRFRNRQT